MQDYGYVDVIIPSYNRSRTICRAINSVFNQTYPYINIIVVDDGSTDETEELLKREYGDKIKFYKHECNKGACAARNTGIAHSNGRFISFLDSDDEWMSDKIEKQLEFLQEHDVKMTFCSYYRVEGNNKVLYPNKQYVGNIHEQLLRGNFLSSGVLLGERECFLLLFDEQLPRLQDWDVMLRISKSYEVKHQHIPLAYYYVQNDSISTNHNKLKTALLIIYDKYKEDFEADSVALANIFRQIAVAEIMTDGKEAHRFLKKANKAHFSFKWFIVQVMCLFGMSKLIKKIKTKGLNKRYEQSGTNIKK